MANAKLELEVNCSPQTALNVLNLAQKACPGCFKDTFYVKAITRVLTLLGDLKQIRWVLQTALAEYAGENGALAISRAAAQNDRPGRRFGRNQLSTVSVANYAQLKAELQLWEEYLHAETVLGLSDVVRLDELRSRRDKVKVLFDEAERIRAGVVYASKDEARAAQQRGLFHPAQDLCDRYDAPGACEAWTLPEQDAALQERCAQALANAVGGRRGGADNTADRNRRKTDPQASTMSTEFHLSMAGLPVILRDLLAKLPFHAGPLPDIEGFVRHMKGVILPPRPEPDASADDAIDTVLLQGAEGADAEGATAAPVWLGKHALDEEEGDDGNSGNKAAAAEEEDVFRKRRRTRKAT